MSSCSTWCSASLIVFHGNLHRGLLGRFRAPLAAVAVLALGVIATSRGRGVKVGIVLSGIMLAVLNLAPGRRLQLARSVAIVLMIALVIGFCGFVAFPGEFLRVTQLDRFVEATPSSLTGTAFWRWIWWKVLWREVLDTDPWFGLGFGQSLSIYNPYLEGDADTAWPVRSPHNFNITVFTRMGFVGAGGLAGDPRARRRRSVPARVERTRAREACSTHSGARNSPSGSSC